MEVANAPTPDSPQYPAEGTENLIAAAGYEIAGVGAIGILSKFRPLKGLTACFKKDVGLGGNPFKGKTAEEIADMLSQKGYLSKGPNPLAGEGNFVNPKTGRGYHIDAVHPLPKGPHVGVHRPREYRDIYKPRDYKIGEP